MIGKVYKFCPLCGGGLVERVIDNKTRRVCTSCDFIHYRNPIPASGVILVENSRVLLVKRKFEPRVGMWTLPAGFVETGEDAASCAIREMKEETNLDVELVRLFNVYSAFDDPRNAVVLILYLGKRTGGDLKFGDDASDARYFDVSDVPEEIIAFKAHKNALSDIKKQFVEGLL